MEADNRVQEGTASWRFICRAFGCSALTCWCPAFRRQGVQNRLKAGHQRLTSAKRKALASFADKNLDSRAVRRLIWRVIAAAPRLIAKKWKQRRWTFDELVAELPESNLPIELWDGELVMSPAPTLFHQEIVDRFHDLLKAWVRPRQLGKTWAAPIDMVLTTRRVVQPDVVFVSSERLDIIKQRIMGPADLVAEVISPESRRRDRIDKRDLYEQHGVREYWLIDPEAKTVEVLHMEAGQYKLAGRWHPGDQAQSRLLKGFVASVGDLLRES